MLESDLFTTGFLQDVQKTFHKNVWRTEMLTFLFEYEYEGKECPALVLFLFFFLGVPLPCTVKMSGKYCQSIFVYIV